MIAAIRNAHKLNEIIKKWKRNIFYFGLGVYVVDISAAKTDRNLKRLIVSHTLFSWTKKTESLQPARMRWYTKIDKPRENWLKDLITASKSVNLNNNTHTHIQRKREMLVEYAVSSRVDLKIC